MTSSGKDRRTPRGLRMPPIRLARGARPAGRAPLRALTPLRVAMSALALISCVGAGQQAAAGQSVERPSSAGQSPAGESAAHGTADPSQASTHPAMASPDPLPNLTRAQMAGQRVIYSYAGLNPPATLLSWIRHGLVGGVIFFGGHICSRAQIAGVIKKLDRANASSLNPLHNVRLLLMTDQEGGVVRRLPGAPVLSEKQIGRSAHPVAAARTAGTGAGKNLAGVGMNANLAPATDVFRRAGNFIEQFRRSYSNNPKRALSPRSPFPKAQHSTHSARTPQPVPRLR